MTQFSLFGAAATAPDARRPGRAVARPAGSGCAPAVGARLSVVVAERWRADALAADFAALGVGLGRRPRSVAGRGRARACAPRFTPTLLPSTRGAGRGAGPARCPPPGSGARRRRAAAVGDRGRCARRRRLPAARRLARTTRCTWPPAAQLAAARRRRGLARPARRARLAGHLDRGGCAASSSCSDRRRPVTPTGAPGPFDPHLG